MTQPAGQRPRTPDPNYSLPDDDPDEEIMAAFHQPDAATSAAEVLFNLSRGRAEVNWARRWDERQFVPLKSREESEQLLVLIRLKLQERTAWNRDHHKFEVRTKKNLYGVWVTNENEVSVLRRGDEISYTLRI